MLGIDTAFDGMAGEGHILLPERQLLAGGNLNLLAHEIDARNRLCDRVFDLQAGVHLDKEELAIFIEELHGADAEIAHPACRLGGDAADLGALLGAENGRGGFLEQFLVTALDRAFALAEMHDIAVAVCDHLNLDMARLAEIAFQIDGVVTKGGLGFGPGRAERFGKVVCGFGDFHAAPAAARGGLDQQRISDIRADRACLVQRMDGAGRSRHQRQA